MTTRTRRRGRTEVHHSRTTSALSLQLRAFEVHSRKRNALLKRDLELSGAIQQRIVPSRDRVSIYYHIMQYVEINLDKMVHEVMCSVAEEEEKTRGDGQQCRCEALDQDNDNGSDYDDDDDEDDDEVSTCSTCSCGNVPGNDDGEPWSLFIRRTWGYFAHSESSKSQDNSSNISSCRQQSDDDNDDTDGEKKAKRVCVSKYGGVTSAKCGNTNPGVVCDKRQDDPERFFLFPNWSMSQHPVDILHLYRWSTSSNVTHMANSIALNRMVRVRIGGSLRPRPLPSMEPFARNPHLVALAIEQQMSVECFLSIFIRQDLDLACFVERLESLSLQYFKSIPLDLLTRILACMTSLRSLRYRASPCVSDHMCRLIAGIPSLRTLDFTACRFSDGKGLDCLLRTLPHLQRLTLNRTNVKIDALQALSTHETLNELNLSFTNIDDAVIEQCIMPNKSLKKLFLDETPYISPSGWKMLFSHPTLTHISARDNYDSMMQAADDDLFERTPHDSRLETLCLMNVDLSLKSFTSLIRLRQLRRLTCSFFDLSLMDRSLQLLSQCTQITSLDISLNNIPNQLIIEHIPRFVGLTELNLQGNVITDSAVLEICDKMPKLKKLAVDTIYHTTTLHSLLLHPSMEELHLIRFDDKISAIDRRFFLNTCSFHVNQGDTT